MELKGIRAIHARQVYSRLLMSFYLMPCNDYFSLDYAEYLDHFENLPNEEKEQILKIALTHSTIDRDDLVSLCSFHVDKNGMAICESNIANYSHDELFGFCLMTLMEISKITVFFYANQKLKKSKTTALTLTKKPLKFLRKILTLGLMK